MIRSTQDVAGALLYYVRNDDEARVTPEITPRAVTPSTTYFYVKTIEGRSFKVTITEEA